MDRSTGLKMERSLSTSLATTYFITSFPGLDSMTPMAPFQVGIPCDSVIAVMFDPC